ncbi:MAG TPA: ABC transporter ATP-binding protein [Bacillota bacterium]|nr:ABC transporter ATP-binding protein [Bacillota bacterium]
MPENKGLLIVTGVGKDYDQRSVLRDVSFSVGIGESMVIAGANGSGKSTLLRILCGLTAPSSGQVIWRAPEGNLNPTQMLRGLGYLSPEVGLYERLSAFEHLQVFSRLRGLSKGHRELSATLERFGLGDAMHRAVGEFSSGMKQRVKLALATIHSPRVLLLDEPGSNLDEDGRQLVREIIGEVVQRGLVLVATNETQEVAEYGQTVLRLG